MPKKPPATLGIIYRMPLEDLHPHPLNPYGVRDDPAMQELVGSVKENGVLIPAIARPRKEGGYELISGHRRKYACEQLGLQIEDGSHEAAGYALRFNFAEIFGEVPK